MNRLRELLGKVLTGMAVIFILAICLVSSILYGIQLLIIHVYNQNKQ